MLSSGGEFKVTSFEMSPVVFVWAVAAAVAPTLPKRDIQKARGDFQLISRGFVVNGRYFSSYLKL